MTLPCGTIARRRLDRGVRAVLLVTLGSGLFSNFESLGADSFTYEADIRPIFREHCFDCHGATDELEGGLDLRLVRRMLSGGENGAAIVLGQPDQSYLVDRLRSGEMPPGEKKVSPGEIEIIVRWIAAGAPTARPEPESIGPGLGITPEERNFWAFQPIVRPDVAAMESFAPEARVLTAIDALLLAKAIERSAATERNVAAGQSSLEPRFSDDAERRVLVVRAYIDLTGLPPTPDQLQTWVNDPDVDWFDRLLSNLLESPHYGERWGRHWLDIAGYADSEGYSVADAERPWAWQYRDWVIRAMNDDKPFDQFILEQLAGDELAGPIQGDLTGQQIDLLTATGFLRMAADGTGSGANNPDGRNQVVTDTLKIIGTSLFGLSLQCAQCHDHRYDPIPQVDYYALRAIFEPAMDWQAWKVPDARRISLYTTADRKRAAEIEAEAQEIAKLKTAKLAEYMQQALDMELMKYEQPLRDELRQTYQTAANERSETQKQLLAKYPSVNITAGNLYQYIPDSKPKLAEFDKQMADVRSRKPPEAFLRALVEPANHTPETKLFHRGDHQQPKQSVVPATLSVLAPAGDRIEFPSNDTAMPTTGRRMALARWLTSRDNPLLARVIVNRIWMHHFGEGLVATPADFGKLGAKPSHPELLDWLADEFIAQGWSLKRLHRIIMTSTAWRQNAELAPANGPDGEGRPAVYPRKPLRLEAETIRDRMLAVAGRLDPKLFGPPLKIKEDDAGQVIVDGEQSRRSLYVQVRRSRPVGMLQTFDAPVMETNCEVRANSTVATQSLMLLNGQFILDVAARMSDRVASDPSPLAEAVLARLPRLPVGESARWQYGYGSYDPESHRTGDFTALSHWTGSQWQAGSQLPDPAVGWAFLNASGGHPDVPERSVIRRWVIPSDGVVSIAGTLSHASAHGDGVRGRIVSSASGLAGEWTVHHGNAKTSVAGIQVHAGDTIDWITDCRTNFTSDSFSWPVTITLAGPNQPSLISVSADQFQGPAESVDVIPGQIVRAWQLAYCRDPGDDELDLAMRFIARQLETMYANPEAIPQGRTATRQAITNLCQALLSSNEFLYAE